MNPDINILLGINGSGNSNFLKAICRGSHVFLGAARVAMWPFVKAFDLGNQAGKSATIQIEDVRPDKTSEGGMEAITPSRVISTGRRQGNLLEETWTQTRERLKSRTNTLYDVDARELIKFSI